MSTLIAIHDLVEHDVFGERRWTGRVDFPGGYSVPLLVIRVQGQLMAVKNRCPHRDMSLLCGRLDEARQILECPSHGWELSMTGPELGGRPVIEREEGLFLVT